MFDTSYIRPRALAAPRRYGLLTASIGLHSGVAIALIAMSIATVEFPDHSPDQTDVYRPLVAVIVPPPLGDGRPPRPEQPVRSAPVAGVRADSAPPIAAPADTSPVTSVPLTPGDATTGPVTGEPGQSGTGGDPNGEPGGTGTDPAKRRCPVRAWSPAIRRLSRASV